MARNQSGPVNTIHYSFAGREAPCVAVDARKAPAEPNRHGLRPPFGRRQLGKASLFATRRERAFSSSVPPKPSYLPSALLPGKRQGTRQAPPKNRRGMDRLFVLSNEIVYEIYVSVSWKIFRLKRFAFQTIRPNIVTDKTRFIRSLAAGRRLPPSHFAFFKSKML